VVSIAVLSAIFAAELALVTLSFTLAYRVIGFANFAHVEFVTFGAFVALTATRFLSLAPAALCGAVAAGLLAVALNTWVFRRLREASVGTKMIASAGIAIALRGAIQFVWGEQPQSFDQPVHSFALDGAQMTEIQAVIIATAVASVIAFAALLKYTRVGRNVRAAADSLALTEIRGVPSSRVLNQVWFISGAMAGLAGVLVGLDTFVRPQLGLSLLVPMFAAATLGGAGSPFGALAGAALVSVAGTAVVSIDFGNLVGGPPHYLGSQYRSAVAFALLVTILVFRRGGFIREQRSRV
jgi:branched-subunit amino acid ABC-type transport system permease component